MGAEKNSVNLREKREDFTQMGAEKISVNLREKKEKISRR